MRRLATPRPFAATTTAIIMIALAGCGSSSTSSTNTEASLPKAVASTPAATATETTASKPPVASTSTTATPPTRAIKAPREHLARIEKVEVSSSAVNKASLLEAHYTCDGSNISLPLRWSGIPAGTAELALFIVNLSPVNGKLFFDWAVAGLNPALHEIPAGKLPPGAVVGANSNGQTHYSLCPPNGKAEAYVAALIAVPHQLGAKPGFNALALRVKALHEAQYQGLLQFVYKHS
jgi:phosphatidylethanolamine-binding protein (PEBP) family uncharacterized protein